MKERLLKKVFGILKKIFSIFQVKPTSSKTVTETEVETEVETEPLTVTAIMYSSNSWTLPSMEWSIEEVEEMTKAFNLANIKHQSRMSAKTMGHSPMFFESFGKRKLKRFYVMSKLSDDVRNRALFKPSVRRAYPRG